MIFGYSDYRSYLKAVLADRIGKNPAYSLRSLARTWEISPALLSKVHRGHKNISLDNAYKISRKLGLSRRETEYFCGMVQLEGSAAPETKEQITKRLKMLNPTRPVTHVSLDYFKVISEWYHLPILEMTNLRGFKLNALNVSKRLGISIFEAEAAIERLIRLGLLVSHPGGKYRKAASGFIAQSNQKNEALRKFHKQMLEKAIASLETQTPDEKFVGSETFSIDPEQLPEAQKRIDDFMNELLTLFAEGKRKSETYHLGIQLFRLTKKGR